MTPLKPSLDDFRQLRETGANLIPVWTELAADYETPVSAFQKLNDGGPCFLLESAESSEQIGRYSFLGAGERIEIRANGREISIRENGGDFVTRPLADDCRDPLAEVEKIMARFRPAKVEGLPIFTGGAVGYLAYDMVRFFEPTVPAAPPDTLGLPDMVFLITDTLVIFDHRFRKLQVVANVFAEDDVSDEAGYAAAREKIDAIVAKLAAPLSVAPFSLMTEPPEEAPKSN
ncbi:MAG: anthranilate synthase component I, partial [Verrucomicrobiae bacterium]|nr:anthranilate synthase component I [Verrucomicrobiae bacterium]